MSEQHIFYFSYITNSSRAKDINDRTARFHASVVDDLRILEEDIDVTEAHDIMLHEQGARESSFCALFFNL